ncbi:MAG: LacI family transcriptional regulator [Thermoanaerobacteraceae bacterium]|nr:LacI family transcriptional regulator [Thermoanaerobacteraceae bacterium]
MPDIKDVAKLANVSIATVSRAFNNKPDVSEKTKKKIFDIAKQIGYEPSIPARTLTKRKTNILGLIVPDISNPYYGEVVRGIEDTCHIYSYNVILCNADNRREKEFQYIDILKNRWVDGIIFHSDYFLKEHFEAFKSKNIPVVLAGRATELDTAYVAIDNFKAAYDAVNYLISLGHERIGIIHGPLDGMKETVDSVARLMGYRKALEEAGLNVYDELHMEADFKAKGAFLAAKKMLEGRIKPTAIFAISDMMAMGAINAIYDSGLRCPEDISVMGFDNIDLCEVTRPALTTIAQPMYEIGAIAARMLIKMIENRETGNIQPKKIILDHKLMIRDSCSRIKN